MLPQDPFNIIICGVGGQGNVKASRILGKMLIQEYVVTIGETFGASQRGGSVMSHIRVSADSLWSPQVPLGKADLVLALEPVEGARVIQEYGSDQTIAILNTRPVYPLSVITGSCTYPPFDELITQIASHSTNAWGFDATLLSLENFGTPLYQNSILLGAVAGLQYIPLDIQSFIQAASQELPSHTLEKNKKAFELGISLTASHQ